MNRPRTMPLDYRNTNSLWGSVLVETLVRVGVQHAVISPGSRSTPLTFALARHPGIEAIPVLDERSAAFFALGLAKRLHRPVLLLCTSGTAGANYFPAIIEAQESGVPLLVITADRPPEMRECRSGQTIDQQKLFGSHVNYYHELAVPEPSLPRLACLRQTIAFAVERTQWPVGGPVHLNAPFRDPLPPIADRTTVPLRGKVSEAFFAHLQPFGPPVLGGAPLLPDEKRGVIITGPVQPADPSRYAQLVEALAHQTGWPVLADSLSPLRSFAAPGQPFVTTYDALARNKKLMTRLRPEFVLSLGGWPVSKTLRAQLDAWAAPVWCVSETVQNPDAQHGRTKLVRTSLEAFVAAQPERAVEGEFCADWMEAELAARAKIDDRMRRISWMFEGKTAWLLAQHLPVQTPLVVANSMPVRDLEYFRGADDRGHAIYCNRGANGIDGTLSTALGIAHGAAEPAVLLTGDLAFLHDTNGLLVTAKLRGSLTVVLVNNEGGGIFEHLPVARFDPPFEEFFTTPQCADLRKLCSAYTVAHTLVRDWNHLVKLVARLPQQGVRVLEIRTDRKRDAAFRKELLADVGKQAG